MRPEVAWIVERLPQGGRVLDYGPLEGAEVAGLAGVCQATCLNLLGKTPVEGARYVDSVDELEAGVFDAALCVHAFGLGLMAWGELTAHALCQLVRPGGRVFVAAPVGTPGMAVVRQYGSMRVFTRESVVEIFHTITQAELAEEAYFERGQPVEWEALRGWPGVIGKEIVQVGAFAFVKANPQPLTLGETQSQDMPEGWTAEWVETVEQPVHPLEARADPRVCRAVAVMMGGC